MRAKLILLLLMSWLLYLAVLASKLLLLLRILPMLKGIASNCKAAVRFVSTWLYTLAIKRTVWGCVQFYPYVWIKPQQLWLLPAAVMPSLVKERPQFNLSELPHNNPCSSYVATAQGEAECEATYMIGVWLCHSEHREIRPNWTTELLMPSHPEARILTWVSAAPGYLKPQIF